MQLLPTLLSSLRVCPPAAETEPVAFSTVAVYTCAANCWERGSTVPVVEAVRVQADPDLADLAAASRLFDDVAAPAPAIVGD